MLNHYQSISCDSAGQSRELFSSSLQKGLSKKEISLDKISLRKRVDGKTHTAMQEFTIPNVSQYFIRNDNLKMTTIEGPAFSSGGGIENDKWFWSINFIHFVERYWVHVYADCAKNDAGIRAIISLYVVDSKGNEIFVGHCPSRYNGKGSMRIANFFHQKEEIDKEKFLPNNSLTLRLKVTILFDHRTPFPSYFPIQLEPKANLPSHFKELYLSRENTGDIVIKIENQSFRAHKEVLKIRCPQLLDMFANQIVQGKNYVEISGIDYTVFEKLLEFLYLDEVYNIDDCIVSLWKEAHELELTALKRICEKTISENFLSVENAYIVKYLGRNIRSGRISEYIRIFLRINTE